MTDSPPTNPPAPALEQRTRGRRWYTSIGLIWTTCARTITAFYDHEIGSFTLLFLVLMLFAVVLYLINAIAPIAPFVYSLI